MRGFAAPHQAAPTVPLATDKGTPLPAEAPCFFFSSFFFFPLCPGSRPPAAASGERYVYPRAPRGLFRCYQKPCFIFWFVSMFLVPFLPLPLLRSLLRFNLPLQRLRCLGYYIYFQRKNLRPLLLFQHFAFL